MIITLSTQYSPKETGQLVAKINKDRQLFKELFVQQLHEKEIEINCKFLDILEKCLKDPIEDVIGLLIPLSTRLGEDFNDNCIVM